MNADFLFVCSESWEKMIPTEKGAFCNVCKKEVIDFSGKKNAETKKILTEKNDGAELCGRFKPGQLLELNFSSFFKKFLLWNLRKRIAVVFFFVLGSMLFSCTSVPGSTHEERLAGTIAIQDTTRQLIPADTIIHNTNPKEK